MAAKPTYEELELRIEEIERKAFGRKLSEEALQTPAGFLDVLVSSVSNGVIVYDDKFRYKLWNKFMENLTGIRAENVLGKSAFDLFPHLREEGIDKLLERALGGETVQSGDTAYHVKDAGKFGWVTGLYSPHVDLSGNIIGVVAMIHDISDHKQAEDMLRESEKRHRLLLEVSPDPIVVYNIEGETIYVNPAFEQTFGWSLDELRNNRIDFVPEENWPETKEAINRMLQGLKIQLFETRRLTKDGKILDIQLSSALFFDRDEKPVGNIVILRDITIQKRAERTLRKAHDELEQRVEERTDELVLINENLQQEIVDRKQTEEALRESEKRYRSVVESQTEMICRFLPDSTITFVNDAYCRFFNMKHKELIGSKFMPLIPESDRKKVFDSISSLSPDASIVTHEHPVLAPDKNLGWHKWTNRAIFDEHNNLLEYQGVGLDITERKQAEMALRESEERFRMIFKNSSDGIIVADPETMKFLYANPAICKMLGYTEEELTQMGVVDIHPKESLEYVVSEFEAQVRGEKLLVVNIPFLKKNETIIYMDTNSSFVRIGEKIRIMGVFRDVTERKLAEEGLQKAHDELENRVEERTRELKIQKSNLEEANISLEVLLEKMKEDKKEIADNVLTNAKELIVPYIEKIRKTKLDDQQKAFLSIMGYNINEITSPFTRKMSLKYLNLTPTEIQVANLIRHGSNSKEIADLLGLSPRTIYNHRRNIRKKFGIENKKTNLRSHLLSVY